MFAKKFAIGIYGTGVGASALYQISENFNYLKNRKTPVVFVDYAMKTLSGVFVGGYCGSLWPLTATGYAAYKLLESTKYFDNKNE